jgi:hypothetical protein
MAAFICGFATVWGLEYFVDAGNNVVKLHKATLHASASVVEWAIPSGLRFLFSATQGVALGWVRHPLRGKSAAFLFSLCA